jgi:hypothetical protein
MLLRKPSTASHESEVTCRHAARGGKRVKKTLFVVAAAVMALLLTTPPAGASTTGASTAAPSDVTGTVSTARAAVACPVAPGNYCARVTFVSVNGGIRVTRTASTGYTTGGGKAREWFRYSCTAGTCFVLPSPTFFYGRRNVQLNVTRRFSGAGFFLPCGNQFGVDYIRPAVNAPGPRAILFRVRCAAGAPATMERIS